MSQLEGYSYLQYDQLEEVNKRLNTADISVKYKASEEQYDDDIGIAGERVVKDQQQFASIATIYKDKADKIEYNSRINELTGNDTQHEEKMNELEGILSNKVSQFEFDKMVATLNANDDSQDARLDLLEQQFTDIQSRIVAEITQKTDELVKTTDFNTMVAQLQAGDTGLHNQIIQLASTESIENALTNYQTLLDNLQEKAPYDTEINKLVQRNYDFEQRLLGVDQFFRVLAETYKLHKDDANKTEIVYTAEFQEGIPLPPAYEITGYKSYVAGSRSFGTRNTQFEDELSVSFTPFGYNTLTGEIKLYDSSNTLIGSINRADINTASFVVDVPISGSISSLTSLNITQTSASGEVIKTETVSQVTIQTLPNITPIRIIESSLSSTDKFTGQNISISTLVEGTGVVTFTPTLPTGLSHTFTNGTLTISGSVSTPISSQQTYTLKISNGITEDEIPVNLLVLGSVPGAPTSLVATSGNGQVSIDFTAGSAGGSAITNYKYSINNGVSYTAFSPAVTTSPVVITGLANGTTYQIKLRAVNSGGDGVESNVVSGTTFNIPSAPTSLTATPGNGQVSIAFTTGSDGGSSITNYKYSINNGTSYTVFSPVDTTSPVVITGLTNGTTYQIKLRAVNAVGDGIESASVSATPMPASFRNVGNTPYALLSNGTIITYSIAENGDVYIGGLFTRVKDVNANNIAKWTKATDTWSALGTGVANQVNAIAISGTDVYVGGNFTTAGGATANRIAKWNTSTSTWSSVGTGGANGVGSSTVNAIAINGSDVYVGGDFTTAGGSPTANRIAKWDTLTSTWSALVYSGLNGLNGTVNAIAVSGGQVYVGGSFTTMQGGGANGLPRIARWAPSISSWFELGVGLDNQVNAIAISGSDIYVGGSFTSVYGGAANSLNRIAKWNTSTSTWSALGTGLSGLVNTIAISGSDIYVGGAFTSIQTGEANTLNRIGKWNTSTSTWSQPGAGLNNIVNAIAISGSDIYIGGSFTMDYTAANLSPGNVIYTANNNQFNNFGGAYTNTTNTVRKTVTDSDGNLYVGGDFKYINEIAVYHIAKWTNATNTWSALDKGLSDSVREITIDGTDIYVGGNFTTSQGGTPNAFRSIAKWDTTTSTWSSLGAGLNSTVNTIAVSGSDVYVGGVFNSVYSGSSLPAIGKWNKQTSTWSNVGTGLNNAVNKIVISGTDVYAGGFFTTIQGGTANAFPRIARWDTTTSTWSQLGAGLNNSVIAIAISGSDIYVGGNFTSVQGGTANSLNRIGKWNTTTSTWSQLGAGLNNSVNDIAISGSDVYAGGMFDTTSGGVANALRFIGKWNTTTSTWSAVGSGLNSLVMSIAISGSDVYAGGTFTAVNGGVANTLSNVAVF